MEFNKNTKPKLTANILMEKFSTSSLEQKYLVIIGEKRFEISNSIHSLLKLIDGETTFNNIAEKYSAVIGKTVSLEDIQYIFSNILEPKGLLQSSNSTKNKTKKKSSYLYFRISIISQKQLKIFTSKIEFLFIPLVLKMLIISIVLFHGYFFISHSDLHINIYSFNIKSIVAIYFLFFVSTLFHELGHSSACKHYGAKHGNIGFGLYLYFPVFYADVTDVWKLPRRQRVVVDFAGIYFQLIFVVILYLIYSFTNLEIFIYTIIAIEISFIFNLNPFLRFDGYWIFSDLTGIPNLRQRSIEVISYLFGKLFSKKGLQKPYIFSIGKKEQVFAYPYLVITSLFFIFLFYRILFFLPTLLLEYPTLFLNTLTSVYDNIVIHRLHDAWDDFSAIVFPTIIILMLLFMSYRMGKRIFVTIYENIRNLYLEYFVKK